MISIVSIKSIISFIRWSDSGLSFTSTPYGDVIGYRMRLDHMTVEHVINKVWVT